MKFRIGHIFCGMGGKGLGAASAIARHAGLEATFETVGGIDFDALACKDFEMLLGAPALCADVHQLEPADMIAFFGETAPDVIMMSPPCKGFSGLLSAKRAAEPKYQKMNTLMERALFLCCSTWPTPPKLIFVENVPRIASRGKDMVRRCKAMGSAHGYAVADGTHDCGELGGLAQHRRRYFQLWRHRAQVAQFVYQPAKQRVRACGEVLGPLPMPGDVEAAGPMHAVPKLSWRNWLRLAMIPAGGDWRDLPGTLGDGEKRREKFRRAPVTAWDATAETVTGPGGSASAAVADPRVKLSASDGRHWNKYAVHGWDDPALTVTGTDSRVGSGAPSVADPRVGELVGLGCAPRAGTYGVASFGQPADTVTGSLAIDNGPAAIADPRFGNVDRITEWSTPVGTITRSPAPSSGGAAVADPRGAQWFPNVYRVGEWDKAAGTVTGSGKPSSGQFSVADPRWGGGRLGVIDWSDPTGTIAGESLPNNGAFSVADPRFAEGKKKNWQQVAGVTPWTESAPTVTGGAKIHTGAFQVADPRIATSPTGRYRVMTLTEALALDLNPDRPPPWIPIIVAADGTWHRPLTTLELAVLQSFPAVWRGKPLVLAGSGHTRWREAIGNAVPPAAAEKIAEQLARALLLSAVGTFTLDNNEIWVAPMGAMVA